MYGESSSLNEHLNKMSIRRNRSENINLYKLIFIGLIGLIFIECIFLPTVSARYLPTRSYLEPAHRQKIKEILRILLDLNYNEKGNDHMMLGPDGYQGMSAAKLLQYPVYTDMEHVNRDANIAGNGPN